jgi:hypothetical protein
MQKEANGNWQIAIGHAERRRTALRYAAKFR